MGSGDVAMLAQTVEETDIAKMLILTCFRIHALDHGESAGGIQNVV